MPFMMDAAFRVIFASTEMDFRRLRGKDLDELTAAIGKEANARIGSEMSATFCCKQLNFVKKDDIRTNWIGNGKHQGMRS